MEIDVVVDEKEGLIDLLFTALRLFECIFQVQRGYHCSRNTTLNEETPIDRSTT
jgi:hypothetical protein